MIFYRAFAYDCLSLIDQAIDVNMLERLASDPKLSPARARELAAAWVFAQYLDEGREMEARERQGTLDAELADLYDQHVEAHNRKPLVRILEELTGSRTILADMDIIKGEN